MGKTKGLIIDSKKFKEQAIKNNIELTSLMEWYDSRAKSQEHNIDIQTSSDVQPLIIQTGYYIISAMVTIGIVTYRIDPKHFLKTIPLIILISLLCINGLYYWSWDYNSEDSLTNITAKKKILLTAISFSLFLCTMILNREYHFAGDNKMFI